MEDRWLSLKEITEYLGIRRETVYRWIENREMPGHRIGKLWKFKKDEVDAWVKSGKAATNLIYEHVYNRYPTIAG